MVRAMPAEPERHLRVVQAADGTPLQYEVVGNGAPIVFLHGGLDGRHAFRRQREVLADTFQLVLRDLRGHNGSAWCRPPDYGIETTEVDDLLHVLDAEGIQRAHLFGHSSGGAIAFAFARRFPERVARLVLVEPSLFQLLPPTEFADVAAFYGGLASMAEAGADVEAAHRVVANVAGPGWEARARPDALALVDSAAPLIAAHLRALLELPVSSEHILALPPALYLFGSHSAPFYRTIFEQIGHASPEAPRLMLEGAGHAVHLQRPAETNAAVRDWFTSVR